MLFSSLYWLGYTLAALPISFAQTWTDCNPLSQTCPADPGLNARTFSSNFAAGRSALSGWKVTNGALTWGPNGARFTVAKHGDAPTIQTNLYFFGGQVDVVMKAAPGRGIVSSIVLQSDDLDEIDWEFLGGVPTQVQTNYFGKGNTTTYDRMIQYGVPSSRFPLSATGGFHTYTIRWDRHRTQWLIDGRLVRTLPKAEAVGGKNYPQTPMTLRLGSWVGGDASNPPGTISWAGGLTDYSKGPFTMVVKSVHIKNNNPARSYTYGDRSGSWGSIKIQK